MEIESMFQKYIYSNKAKMRLKQTTISTYYRRFEGYILPFFKQEEINETSIEAFTTYLQSRLSDKTTASVLGLLSEILSYSGLQIDIYKPVVYPPEIVIFKKRSGSSYKITAFPILIF